jgi:hypothetical protein
MPIFAKLAVSMLNHLDEVTVVIAIVRLRSHCAPIWQYCLAAGKYSPISAGGRTVQVGKV